MAYNAEYQRPYEGGYVNKPDESTPEMAEFINARDDTLLKIEQFLANLDLSGLGSDYALLSEAGYSLGLDINENYIMTISIKNKAGAILDSKSIDFPIESSIIDIDYADGNLILTLQNGNSVSVGISDIVRGLVPTTRKIAGIDLADDITKEELKDAIGIYDDVVSAGEIKPWLYIENEEVIVGTYNGKPLYRKTLPPISVSADRTMYALDVEYDSIMIDNSASFLVDNEGTILNTCSIGMMDDINLVGDYTCNILIVYDKNICFRKGASITYTAYITIQYTKTTDAEGSGNDLKPYGIYDAKLDEIKAEIDEVKNAITETTEATMPNSHEGRLLIKKIGGVCEQGENPSPTSPQEIKNSVVSVVKTHDDNGNESFVTLSPPIKLYEIGDVRDVIEGGKVNKKFEKYELTGSENIAEADSYFTIPLTKEAIGGTALCDIDSLARTTKNYARLQKYGMTLDDFKAYLVERYESGNPAYFIYRIAEEVKEDLPLSDQIALNSLSTFDGITYLEFDSEIEPAFECEYGTSKHGGYTLASLLTARNNDLRLSSLEASVVNNI